jgi:hypothetical protein
MLLPVQNGRVVRDRSDSMLLVHPVGILISPTDNFAVCSCSEGKVTAVTKLQERYLVVVASDDKKDELAVYAIVRRGHEDILENYELFPLAILQAKGVIV